MTPKTTTTIKTAVPCARCQGSGQYSFNPVDGTVCYGCRGTGTRYVNLARVAQTRARRVARDARRAAYHDAFRTFTHTYAQTLLVEHGWSFDLDTERGWDGLNHACATTYGEGFWHRRDRLLPPALQQRPL